MIYSKYAFQVPESQMIRLIIDSDARNEADDQYCIVHALLSPRFDNRGIIAAHYGTKKRPDSMEASFEEVCRILDLMNFDRSLAFRGAESALEDAAVPHESDGARLIVREAMKEDDRPLYVIFLGPLTDMASAYLMEPRIARRMTCVWIGGNRYPAGGPEYNCGNDMTAANVVFRSDIPLWQIPRDVYKKPVVSLAELQYRVRPCGGIGRYLFDQLNEHQNTMKLTERNRMGEFWCLGDSPAVGVLLYEHPFDFEWRPAPEFGSQMEYLHTGLNRAIRVYTGMDQRFILEDFFAKLAMFAQNPENGSL